MGKREHHLGDRFERLVGDNLSQEYETLWVRARIGQVFGLAPPSPLGKRCLLDAAFLAVRHLRRGPFVEAYPFVCTDSDGEEPVEYEWFDTTTGLAFGPPGRPGPATRVRIAEAFWELLLKDPDDLATFGDYYESHFGPYRVGCDGRDFTCDEIHSEQEDETEDHSCGYGFVGKWPCPNCDGEGIELFADLIEQACETCRGTGAFTWAEDGAGRLK